MSAPQLPDPNQIEYSFGGSAQYLFNRSWSVTIGTPGLPGRQYTDLRTVFEIEKTSFSSSNKAKVQIYNLNDQSRQHYVKGMLLTLAAGYVGLTETLFVGNISRVSQERKKADIITTFECGDGEKELYSNFIDKSYPPGTTIVQVVQDLIGALGLPLGTVSGLSQQVYNSGFVASGGVKQILDKILKKQGLEWSVQNGHVQIIPVDSHNGDSAVVINQTTGLIGVPTKGDGGDNIVKFNSLLNPKLFPGAPVSLESTLFNGVYKIRNAKIEGDSHGNKWQVSCECESVPNAFAPTQNKASQILIPSSTQAVV